MRSLRQILSVNCSDGTALEARSGTSGKPYAGMEKAGPIRLYFISCPHPTTQERGESKQKHLEPRSRSLKGPQAGM